MQTKPLLRGYLHLGAAALTLLCTTVLLILARGDTVKQISLLVYGASAELLFAMSALYHIGAWRPATRALLRRLDHANIFVLIGGTYTPIAVNLLAGGWRAGILAAIWLLALGGIVLAVLDLPLPRLARVGLYVATGWVALAAVPEILAHTGGSGLLVLLAGGLLYTAGALAYALKRPDLWPRVFGYHELFHLATVAANGVFFAFMVAMVLPALRS
ncbi:MAG TPA: hemolysin III family protein [Ktedonobacterales bacterium]